MVKSSNVMAEEKQTKNYLYLVPASCPQKRYKHHELWWTDNFTKTEDFEMSEIQINWNKGDLHCYFSDEV